MCGRYAASATATELEAEFGVEEIDLPAEAAQPRFNIAPTDPVAAVLTRHGARAGAPARALVGLRWGLVPSWSAGPASGAPLINARAETVATKPSFRKAFAARRCLLPADGYYEWYSSARTDARGRAVKQPFFIHPTDGRLFMAGLYEFWKSPAGDWLSSCCIITTTAADELGHIHDRMPMTVRDVDAWLDPSLTDPPTVQGLLRAPRGLTAHAVSRLVSNVRNDGPELVAPLPVEPAPDA